MSKIEGTCGKLMLGRYNMSHCRKPAKVEYKGKLYCGVHNPAKLEARHEKLKAMYEADQQARKAKEEAIVLRDAKAAAFDWLVSRLMESTYPSGFQFCTFPSRLFGKGDTPLAAVQDAIQKEAEK